MRHPLLFSWQASSGTSSTGTSLESQFKQLEAGGSVDDELAAMKKVRCLPPLTLATSPYARSSPAAPLYPGSTPSPPYPCYTPYQALPGSVDAELEEMKKLMDKDGK